MTDAVNTPWVIELSNPQIPSPLKLRLETRLVVGRSVAGDSTKVPDIDLAPYGAEEFGVSRQHLVLYAVEDRLMVMDMESGNGTFLNDNRLKPNDPHRLSHEDVLQLGRMKLKLKVIIAPSYGGEVHKQPSLQLQDQVHPGNGQLILIVEDDPEVAKVMSLMMEKADYTTRVSHDVVGAIRMYNQKRPSAVILDLMLPDMNGLEFCRYIRRDVVQNMTPIIICSASSAPGIVTEAMQAGADIFLNKPVSAKELRHVVASLVHQRENGKNSLHTKHLVGTAPLTAIAPESRRDAVVLFVAGYSDAPITLNVQQPISFGRAVKTGTTATLGGKNHIDLTRYDAVNNGVSRIHMVLHNKGGKFFIADSGTVNGTFLNGDPLKPNDLVPVRNADEIRLGQLRMYIYFLEDAERTLS